MLQPMTVSVDLEVLSEILSQRINSAVTLYTESADFMKFIETTVHEQVDESLRAIVSVALSEMFNARRQEFVDRAASIAVARAQEFFSSLDRVR